MSKGQVKILDGRDLESLMKLFFGLEFFEWSGPVWVELEGCWIDFESEVFSGVIEDENEAGEGEEEDDDGGFPVSHWIEIK